MRQEVHRQRQLVVFRRPSIRPPQPMREHDAQRRQAWRKGPVPAHAQEIERLAVHVIAHELGSGSATHRPGEHHCLPPGERRPQARSVIVPMRHDAELRRGVDPDFCDHHAILDGKLVHNDHIVHRRRLLGVIHHNHTSGGHWATTALGLRQEYSGRF